MDPLNQMLQGDQTYPCCPPVDSDVNFGLETMSVEPGEVSIDSLFEQFVQFLEMNFLELLPHTHPQIFHKLT